MQPISPEANPEEVVAAVHDRSGSSPFDLAIILGSGLGGGAEQLSGSQTWHYNDFPFFPRSNVAGHAGRLVAGTLHGRRVLVFQGRFHLYQGLTARQVAVPVQLAHALGCGRILLTNAVGGIDPVLSPGDFIFIDDHINLLGDNPLRGMCGDTFIDLTGLYRTDLYAPLKEEAVSRDIPLSHGILAAVPGPSYETPAEVRALRKLGADVVSMSLVPEAIMGCYFGMQVVGLSFVTNRAAGLGAEPLCHDEVLVAGRKGVADLAVLIELLCKLWFA